MTTNPSLTMDEPDTKALDLEAMKLLLKTAAQGPWTANFRFGAKTCINGRQRFIICDTATAPLGEKNRRREEGNAALIVAAVNALPVLIDRLTAAEARATLLAEQVARMRKALEPFAALARPRHPIEEPNGPSLIDMMTARGEYDELRLESFTYATLWMATLDADDFRQALSTLTETGAGEPKILTSAEIAAWPRKPDVVRGLNPTLIRHTVSKDICPDCEGGLDTGWECNNCGKDWIAYAPDQRGSQ